MKQASPRYWKLKIVICLTLIFVERSEKLSVKIACDVNVGQVKKRGKFKTVFFESTWRRNFGGLCGHKPRKNKQFVFKSCKFSVVITLLFNFLEDYIIAKRTLTTALIFLRCTTGSPSSL